jgi:hypothetical protein
MPRLAPVISATLPSQLPAAITVPGAVGDT